MQHSKLCEAANLRQDERMILAMSGSAVDAIACDILYLPTCYKNKKTLDRLRDRPEE